MERVEEGRSVVVTQRGRAAAVMVSPESLDDAEEERRFMRAVVHGLRDIETGDVVEEDEVWSELDQVMSRAEAAREGQVE
jgi:prevent-host-death family protein